MEKHPLTREADRVRSDGIFLYKSVSVGYAIGRRNAGAYRRWQSVLIKRVYPVRQSERS